MDDKQVTVYQLSWPDLCPALLIFRALPTALSLTVLVLALLGAVLAPIGWVVLDAVLVTESMTNADPALARATEINGSPYKAVYPDGWSGGSVVTVLGNQLHGIELVFKSMVGSFAGVFSVEPGLKRFCYFLFGSVWTLSVWSFFGCAICRSALMRYTRDDAIGIEDAFNFAVDKFLSCFAGITIPLLAVIGLTVPLAIFGLLMTTNLGAVVGGILWFIVLLLSLMIAIILLGLTFAWPLIICAVCCEGQDSFDGMSRAFAYVFQRPLHFLMYSLIGIVFSGLCWLVMSVVIEGTIHTAWWATSWGANIVNYRTGDLSGESPISASSEENLARQVLSAGDQVRGRVAPGQPATESVAETPSTSLKLAQQTVGFWNGAAKTMGAAFLYGLFWCIASAMYLLLRKDLDDTELDEIYLVDQRRSYELPPLQDTENGVPIVQDNSDPATDSGPTDAEESADD